jgi:class 3 adenylate cyclase
MDSACPSCGAAHPPDARFCIRCGTALSRPCPGCGSEQQAAAAFCSACGTTLDGAARWTGADEQQERRVATVLFADLVGSTALGSTLDPEDVRELQGELFELVGTQVERFGGVTEKFVGDAVLAVFGVPQAYGDDAERAVRAGLAVLDRFPSFAGRVHERHGAEVGLRVGINTGDVVSSREAAARGELIVSGDAVNVAARLQETALPGELIVGDRTRVVTQRIISYGPARDLDLKGKARPVRAWQALGTLEDAGRGASGLSAPLIGRDSELALLLAVASRTDDHLAPQLVTLYGQAGVGKSRLVAEFLDRLGASRVLKGRCLPYGQGSPYWALAEAAKAHAGILDTDAADVALRKLKAAVEPLLPGRQASEAVEAIGWTMGFAPTGAVWRDSDPSEASRRLREAWAELLGGLGRDELAVVVIEDLHWASSALLELLDHVADSLSDARLLLVCTARPELLELRPAWGAGKQNATALAIPPLTPESAADLVSALLGAADLPAALCRRVLATAEGNPFFVEEMLQMLIEQGALERRDGGWLLADEHAGDVLPDSVHGVVAARIDLLEPAARDALRHCAVVGRVFWPAAVDADEELIATLARRSLVSLRPASAMAGMREFAFKHAVTRDVAYSTLPRAERRALHRRTAEWIEGVAPDPSLETLELTAYHYGEAIAYGEDDPGVVRRAFELLLAAGNGAADWAAFEVARPRLQRALDLATTDLQRAEAELGLARLDCLTGSLETALQRLDDLGGMLPRDALELRADALAWRSRVCWLLGRWAESLASANQAVDALAGLPESPQLARALARRSQIEMLRTRPEAIEHGLEAIAVARRVGDAFAELNAEINVLTARAAQRGEPPDPDQVLAIVEAARRLGSSEELYRVIVNFVWSATGYLTLPEIESTLAEARARAGSVRPSRVIGTYLEVSIAGMLLVPAGRWSEADAILASFESPPVDATVKLVWLGLVAGLALRRGDLALAGQLVEELRPSALATGEPQRIIPMACTAVPWAAVSGEQELLRSLAEDVLGSVADGWSLLSCLPVVRGLAAAGEVELLERFARSLERNVTWPSSLATSLQAAEGLLALLRGLPGEAWPLLAQAAERERYLGNAFNASCLDLDLARALDAAGDAQGSEAARSRAASVLEPLGCVNPF